MGLGEKQAVLVGKGPEFGRGEQVGLGVFLQQALVDTIDQMVVDIIGKPQFHTQNHGKIRERRGGLPGGTVPLQPPFDLIFPGQIAPVVEPLLVKVVGDHHAVVPRLLVLGQGLGRRDVAAVAGLGRMVMGFKKIGHRIVSPNM